MRAGDIRAVEGTGFSQVFQGPNFFFIPLGTKIYSGLSCYFVIFFFLFYFQLAQEIILERGTFLSLLEENLALTFHLLNN